MPVYIFIFSFLCVLSFLRSYLRFVDQHSLLNTPSYCTCIQCFGGVRLFPPTLSRQFDNTQVSFVLRSLLCTVHFFQTLTFPMVIWKKNIYIYPYTLVTHTQAIIRPRLYLLLSSEIFSILYLYFTLWLFIQQLTITFIRIHFVLFYPLTL